MSKHEIKELFAFILFSIINIGIAYFITSSLGIQNVILLQSYTAMNYVITYEVLIFFALSLFEGFIYEEILCNGNILEE